MTSKVSFVRKDTIPASPPPVTETGIVKWLRENLFSSWINSLLTIAAVYFVYLIVKGAFPWFANGVWSASNLAECREQLNGTTGACFAVIADRWQQMLYGISYPASEYWRPTVAFFLLFVAVAPVLFASLPRKALVLTVLYPFVAFWLIWGGTLWYMLGLLALFIATYGIYKLLTTRLGLFPRQILGAIVGIATGLYLAWLLLGGGLNLFDLSQQFIGGSSWSTFGGIILLLMAGFLLICFIPMGIFVAYACWQSADRGELLNILSTLIFLWIGLTFILGPVSNFLEGIVSLHVPEVASRDLGGFMLNMILGTVCVSLSIPLGILLALGRQSSLPFIKGVCVIFIEFIRGVPLITLLFVANVVLAYFFPLGSSTDLVLRVIIMITLFSAAYIAEVIRGGLAALPKGQYEAGDSLGLDYSQSMRLIVLPQALKISIPGIVNVAVGLFKDTTLVSVISMFDLVGAIRGPIQSSTDWTGVYWEVFGFAALLFFVVCYGISQYSQWLERQLQTEHR